MEIRKAAVMHGPGAALCGKEALHSVKLYGQAKGFYQSAADVLPDDTVMYEVYEYTKEDEGCAGRLSWGLTI